MVGVSTDFKEILAIVPTDTHRKFASLCSLRGSTQRQLAGEIIDVFLAGSENLKDLNALMDSKLMGSGVDGREGIKSVDATSGGTLESDRGQAIKDGDISFLPIR